MSILHETAVSFGTLTTLHGLASSSTLLAGFTTDSVNTALETVTDHKIVGGIKVSGVAPTDNTSILLFAYEVIENTATPNWLDLFSAGTEGTEGTATIHSEDIKNSGLKLIWSTNVDTTINAVYPITGANIAEAFGHLPPRYALFLTQNSGQALNASGSTIYRIPVDYS